MHDGLLDTIEHPNPHRYPNQRIFIIKVQDYVYLVPLVETEVRERPCKHPKESHSRRPSLSHSNVQCPPQVYQRPSHRKDTLNTERAQQSGYS